MYIGNSVNFLGRHITVSAAYRPPPSGVTNATGASSAETARLGRTLVQTQELRQSLVDLDRLARAARTTRGRAAEVRSSTVLGFGSPAPVKIASSADIGLVHAPTPTVLRSNAEINATPTSFSPFGPDWVGSTLQASISGAYNGLNGTDTLTFQVDREGIRGTDDLKIKVYDSNGDEIDAFDIKREDPLDTQYTLDNGLVLTFGQGDLIKSDTFTVDVDAGDPDAYSPTEPAWVGSSALATVGGVYDGTNGTDSLTFRVDQEGIHGQDDLKVKVYNSNQDEIDAFDIKKDDPLDTQYTLANGLTFTLGEGFLRKGTSLTVDVFDTVGSAVDPSRPLDGTRDLNPNLESGFAVAPGAFEVNGVSIAVNAGDSIDDVLARVNTLSTGVSASFDVATESILFTQQTPGSAPTISVGNDTSGFLAATKLSTATVEPGADRDAPEPMATVEAFSAVTSGALSVNGVGIAIDPAADSLLDVLARINASGAGVTASLDGSDQRVSLDSNQSGADLVLDSGATGFFAALNIAEGTHNPSAVLGPDSVLSSIPALSGVQSGTLQLNGVAVDVDVDSDSLEDLVARINASGAGVTAGLASGSGRLTLTGQDSTSPLAIDEGITGFFSALGIAEDSYAAVKVRKGLSSARARELSEAVEMAAKAMNGLFANNILGAAQDPVLTRFRNDIEKAVARSFEPGRRDLERRFGIRVDFDARSGGVFDFNAEDQDRFRGAARRNFKSLRTFLIGQASNPNDGLVGGLSRVVDRAYRELTAQGHSGLLFNASA